MKKKLIFLQCSYDENCSMCTGETCSLCGAGTWNYNPDPPCVHDVMDRHTTYTKDLTINNSEEKAEKF